MLRLRSLLVLLPVAAHAAGAELELAPGYAWSTDISASAPVVRGRLGVELPWVTPSIIGLAALGDPGVLTHFSQQGGWSGWGVGIEARFHTSGEHRFVAALGFGWGQLSKLQVENGDLEGYRGKPAPYVAAAAGYQWVHDDLRLGLELTLDVFNRVNLVGDLGTRNCPETAALGFPECPTGRSFPMLGLAVTLGVAQ